MINLYPYSLGFTALASFLLGSFVIYKNPKNPINLSWGLSCFGCGGWSLFFVFSIMTKNPEHALIFIKILNVIAGFMIISIANFCEELTDPQKSNKRIIYVGCLVMGLITISAFGDHFVGLQYVKHVGAFSKSMGYYYWLYTALFYFYCLYSEYLLLRSLLRKDISNKRQISYVLIGITSGFLGGGITFLPSFGVYVDLTGTHFVWLYAAIISYAIIKHQLMDIQVVIKKTFVFFILTLMISAIYLVGIFVIQNVISKSIQGSNSAIAGLFLTLFIALLLKPMEWYSTRFAEKIFFKGSISEIAEQKEKLVTEIERSERLKSVGVLAAGMAHEIKNPLTSLKTFAQFLPTKYDDPEFREKFSRIVSDEVDRVNNIVKQLLDFARPQDAVMVPVDANAIMEDTLQLLSNNLLKGNIQLKKNFDAHSLLAADKNQLKQVLLNIILNAIQAMPGGGVLTVATDHVDSRLKPAGMTDGGFIVISIKDTGAGIPKNKTDKIFDPFFTTKNDGTGLGLSIVHGIIQNHGGKIEVLSQVGVGTEFRIFLPKAI